MLPKTKIINYEPAPTLAKFMLSDAFVRGVRGAVGSGKSVCCCMEIMRRIREIAPCADGVRRSRWLIIRNTLPQLETTTLKTWLDWFPEATYGHVSKKPPFQQKISIQDPSGYMIEAEILFLALDKPDDVKKVLSLECTGAWINEAREIPKEILDSLSGRVGRYPSKKDMPDGWRTAWPSWSGIIMDTNPPTDDHWWYDLAEVHPAEGYEFFSQPSGMSKQAENVENLPNDYYPKLMAGKSQEWIDVYVHGKYGIIEDGQPVYGKNYSDDIHLCARPIEPFPELPLYVGLDFGLTPCAIFGQRDWRGCWWIFQELITTDTSIDVFAQLLASELRQKYADFTWRIYGDPAGGFRNPNDGKTGFQIFAKPPNGLQVLPAPTNLFPPRKEAVLRCLTQMVDGHPRLMLDKRCNMIRRGFNGGYKYKRIATSGEARYTHEPDKNKFSHPHDALQYMLCGGGEYRDLMSGKGNQTAIGTVTKMKKWNAIR